MSRIIHAFGWLHRQAILVLSATISSVTLFLSCLFVLQAFVWLFLIIALVGAGLMMVITAYELLAFEPVRTANNTDRARNEVAWREFNEAFAEFYRNRKPGWLDAYFVNEDHDGKKTDNSALHPDR